MPEPIFELEAEDCYHLHHPSGPVTFYCMPAGYVFPAGVFDPAELQGRLVSIRLRDGRTVSARVAHVQRTCVPFGTAAHPYPNAFGLGLNRYDPDCRSCDVSAENWTILS